MAQGDVYRHIRLLKSSGEEVPLPFLELEQELWNHAGTRLTLLFDPGRIKRGLRSSEEAGSALEEGGEYALELASAWNSVRGAPLGAPMRHTFRVSTADRAAPTPSNWSLEQTGRAGTREPLVVLFPEPLDHALLHRLLWVERENGEVLPGEVTVDQHETRWKFRPNSAWSAGKFHLQAGPWLEDLAGNRIGRPFEVDARPTPRLPQPDPVTVEFYVGN